MTRLSTTPFGRRSLTLAHVASQASAKTRPPKKAVHKWNIFRAICTAKNALGVPERALAVLDALLSFHPETVLTGEGLIVFPSNHQLGLRAHGMPMATLRRHLAALVDAGLIVRRDSPNGKRYARKGRGGEIEFAFGFDLAPLVVRAEEFEALAAEVEAEARALRLVRERITICRRDIVKMIATGLEEGVSTQALGQGPADWAEIHQLYRGIMARVPRSATRLALEPIADELSLLADEILNLLENHIKTQNM
ncbi:MAG: replication initiation protein RepC, partial [Hyphomicrobiales bacterium]